MGCVFIGNLPEWVIFFESYKTGPSCAQSGRDSAAAAQVCTKLVRDLNTLKLHYDMYFSLSVVVPLFRESKQTITRVVREVAQCATVRVCKTANKNCRQISQTVQSIELILIDVNNDVDVLNVLMTENLVDPFVKYALARGLARTLADP